MLELINKCPLREWKVLKLSPAIFSEWSTLIPGWMGQVVPNYLSCPWSQIFRASAMLVQLMASSLWGVTSQATDYTVDHIQPPSSAAATVDLCVHTSMHFTRVNKTLFSPTAGFPELRLMFTGLKHDAGFFSLHEPVLRSFSNTLCPCDSLRVRTYK